MIPKNRVVDLLLLFIALALFASLSDAQASPPPVSVLIGKWGSVGATGLVRGRCLKWFGDRCYKCYNGLYTYPENIPCYSCCLWSPQGNCFSCCTQLTPPNG